MRAIEIRIILPDDIEPDYTGVHPQLVIEDLFKSDIGFEVIGDTVENRNVQGALCQTRKQ